jgi:hypothetical protein
MTRPAAKRIRRYRERILENALNGRYWDVEPEIVGVSRGTQTIMDGRDMEILILKRDMARLNAEMDVIMGYSDEMEKKLEDVGFELRLLVDGLE